MNGFDYLSGVTTLELDVGLCNGCRMCLNVCPHQVFAMHDKQAAIVALDKCMECGACALNCAEGAIKVDSGVGCAAGLIYEWWRTVRPFKGSNKPSSCC
ncbi:MAG: ferredoxin [Deltaproteobacteria bacterium RIFOXYA12_FULL_58_15]|nr:MAG: ferredoxin [Deltaproteobacteria bacterium RIFOXYA12_FULL_58_15]